MVANSARHVTNKLHGERTLELIEEDTQSKDASWRWIRRECADIFIYRLCIVVVWNFTQKKYFVAANFSSSVRGHVGTLFTNDKQKKCFLLADWTWLPHRQGITDLVQTADSVKIKLTLAMIGLQAVINEQFPQIINIESNCLQTKAKHGSVHASSHGM